MNAIVSPTTGRSPKPGSIIAKVGEFLHTKDGKGRPQTLTPVEAHVTFGTMRLASAVEELRNKYGLPVLTTMKRNHETGVEYASYSLESFKKGDRVRVQSLAQTRKHGLVVPRMQIGDEGKITEPSCSGDVFVRLDNGEELWFAQVDLRRLI